MKVIVDKHDFIEEVLKNGTEIYTISGNEYFYLPFWFKKVEEGFEMIWLDGKLPDDLVNEINLQKEDEDWANKMFWEDKYYEGENDLDD